MTTYEQRDTLLQAKMEIEKWEKEQRDLWFWEKIGRIPFMIIDKLSPKILQRKVGQVLDEVGSYLHTGGRYLIQEKHVLNKIESHWKKTAPQQGLTVASIDDVQHVPLAVRDEVASQLRESHKTAAFAQGATTGFGGIFTLAIDIPAILGISLKVIQETAISYGFDPNEREERVFVVKCMQFASSDIVGKQAILKELTEFHRADRDREALSEMQGWRETMIAFTDNFGWKKLFQAIPIAGMVFGSFMNRSLIHDVAETAQMMYRKRVVLKMLQEMDNEDGEIS
ncbi:EcsC family protein [Paenibacillus sp. UMB4589-SE434]|uniref:EcsC family protein n=1 Tax=Paenibacillus sp. UMB4589-SE434 TaxID=3046314 RepID=UPI00254AB44F|nr:EcsC family protein [Paenibacillus sp. UMB4589-SE434]MDK8182963.1 EcsC family protein [Paenibacillus sp. UMB4589-SE434]